MFSKALKKITSDYLEEKNKVFANNEFGKFVRNIGKDILKQNLPEYDDTLL